MTDYSQLARLAENATGPAAARQFVGAALAGSSEMLALAHAAVHPLAVVSGTAVSRISTGLTSSNRLGEIASLTSAMEAARKQAVTRLVAAARQYGASGVVGVSPRIRWHGHHRHHTLELTLVGTAVTTADASTKDGGRVFAATLDGVAVARLIWSGWQPVGLALGVSVFGFPRRRGGPWLRSSWHGGEAAQPTSALYAAREVALRRLQDDARSLTADGVVGIDLRHDQHVWGRRAIELSAIGTAVARTSDAETLRAPALALSVTDAAGGRPTDLR
jgi:uncharacterized protein YbjQ (UPF0145 family)